MISTLAEIFASTGLGALVGLLGSWLTKHEERRNLKLKLAHDIKMADIRKQEAAFEFEHELAMADKQVERSQAEGDIARDVAEMSAFREGLKEQQMIYRIKWVDAIRGVMRPVITIYLLALATLVTIKISSTAGGLEALDRSAMDTLYSDTITRIFFLVTTAVTWWFGSRPSSPRKI